MKEESKTSQPREENWCGFLPGYLVSSWVENHIREAVQPAGIDLTVAEIREFNAPGLLGREERRIPLGKPLEPINGVWKLPLGAYRIRFREIVEIPVTGIGFCYPRSSLLRMGALLHCAVWDPGYKGRGEALLYVANPYGVEIEVGARIAQLVIARVHPAPREIYRGAYQLEGVKQERR